MSASLRHREVEMQSNPVIWFEIYVQDMPRAKAFYEGVLGGKALQKLPSGDLEMWAFGIGAERDGHGRRARQDERRPIGGQQHPGLFRVRRLLGGGVSYRELRRASVPTEAVHRPIRLPGLARYRRRPCALGGRPFTGNWCWRRYGRCSNSRTTSQQGCTCRRCFRHHPGASQPFTVSCWHAPWPLRRSAVGYALAQRAQFGSRQSSGSEDV